MGLVRAGSKIFIVMFLALFLACGSAYAFPNVTDGIFADAGLDAEWGAGNWFEGDGVVNPGQGGQPYDVEYLGLNLTGDRLYFGLQTGFNLQAGWAASSDTNNSNSSYDIDPNQGISGHFDPGDFAIDINNDGSFEYAIRFFDRASGGFNPIQLLAVSDWYDVDYTQHMVATPFRAKNFSTIILEDSWLNYAWGRENETAPWVLEGSLYLPALGITAESDVALQWTMECGNDWGRVPTTPVPEPATMLLLGTCMICLAIIGRKKIIKN